MLLLLLAVPALLVFGIGSSLVASFELQQPFTTLAARARYLVMSSRQNNAGSVVDARSAPVGRDTW